MYTGTNARERSMKSMRLKSVAFTWLQGGHHFAPQYTKTGLFSPLASASAAAISVAWRNRGAVMSRLLQRHHEFRSIDRRHRFAHRVVGGAARVLGQRDAAQRQRGAGQLDGGVVLAGRAPCHHAGDG